MVSKSFKWHNSDGSLKRLFENISDVESVVHGGAVLVILYRGPEKFAFVHLAPSEYLVEETT
jgi:hypothetical protein